MSIHNFQALYDQYPTVIQQMRPTFTAHEFILRLAHDNQVLYIQALAAYCSILRAGHPAPFMMVHGILAQRLNDLPEMVRYIGETDSYDIFGQEESCSQWQRLDA